MPETVQLVEVIWFVVALIGLIEWIMNGISSYRTRVAAAGLTMTNGRRLWADFSLYLTYTMVFIESLFLFAGVIAMFVPSPPSSIVRTVIISSLIITSLSLTYLGFRWKKVDSQLLEMARDYGKKKAEE